MAYSYREIEPVDSWLDSRGGTNHLLYPSHHGGKCGGKICVRMHCDSCYVEFLPHFVARYESIARIFQKVDCTISRKAYLRDRAHQSGERNDKRWDGYRYDKCK